jgi:hypothetical protein
MDLFSSEIKPLQSSDIQPLLEQQKQVQEITQKMKAHIRFIQALSLKTKSAYVQNALNVKK